MAYRAATSSHGVWTDIVTLIYATEKRHKIGHRGQKQGSVLKSSFSRVAGRAGAELKPDTVFGRIHQLQRSSGRPGEKLRRIFRRSSLGAWCGGKQQSGCLAGTCPRPLWLHSILASQMSSPFWCVKVSVCPVDVKSEFGSAGDCPTAGGARVVTRPTNSGDYTGVQDSSNTRSAARSTSPIAVVGSQSMCVCELFP